MKFRKHQEQALTRAKAISNGSISSKITVADVTPGGGKSLMANVFALQLLQRGVIDSVLSFVPRSTLAAQVDMSWAKLRADKELNPSGLFIDKVVRNVAPLYRQPAVGIVATYNQLANNPDLYLESARLHRTLIVLDEAQFLADKECASWSRAVKPLVEVAAHTLVMSGTIWRHDGERIPFVEYERGEDGKLYAKADISFSLAEAVATYSVKPVSFTLMNADVSYIYDGDEKSRVLSDTEKEERSRALRAFLSRRETWSSLVDRAIEHWQDFREHMYRSRMIVVATTQEHARVLVDYIEQKHGHKCALVISDEENAAEVAKEFREKRRPDIMVTVAMASVGFDAPDCTHMVYLSNIRSIPYALQAFARVTRIDPSCGLDPEVQTAYIFAPKDTPLVEVAAWMREEQRIGIDDWPGTGGGGGGGGLSDFIATAANPLECSFDSQTQKITNADSKRIEQAYAEVEGIRHLPPATVLKLLNLGSLGTQSQSGAALTSAEPTPSLTPTEERELLRVKLQQITSAIDSYKRAINQEHKHGDTNRALIAATGKSVNDCSLEEMQARYTLALSWLKESKQNANTRRA